MSSPFTVFRKHQKGMIAGLIIVAMVSFIVLGTVDQFNRPGPGGGPQENRLVATWKGGKLTQKDVQRLTDDRLVLNRFFNGLAEMAAKNAGQPAPGPFQVFDMDARDAVVASLQAEEARRLGIVVPDEQVMRQFTSFTGDTVSDSQMNTILKAINSQEYPVTLSTLVEAMRNELLAGELRNLYDIGPRGYAYMYDASPAERWEYFNRLNRRVKLQVYPIEVDDYINDPRIPNPDDKQLADFYNAYKDNVSSPSSPEPGFKDPPGVKLEYIKADYVKFFEKAKAALTEEEILKDFETRKESLRSSLEAFEGMTSRDLLDAIDEKADATKDPLAVRASEPDPTPYEEATGKFAKRAPRATEPRFTDEEILARERESIVKRMAEERARDLMREALDETYREMSRFYEVEYRRWLVNSQSELSNEKATESAKTSAPKFDLAKLAKPDDGLTYHQTAFLSGEEIQRDKVLSETYVNRRWTKTTDPQTKEVTTTLERQGQGTPLGNYVFANKTKMSPFRAEDEIAATGAGTYRNQYVFWKTDERKEQVPAFDDIKNRVVQAWKIANNTGKSARDLARENAQKIADEINGNRVDGKVQTLKERFADSPDVKETEEFTWYEPLQMPTGAGQFSSIHLREPERTKLEEVEIGEDRFLREVNRLADRQAGAAMNDAGSIVYVVQVFDSPSSTTEKLREQFQRTTYRLTQRQDGRIPSEQGVAIVSYNDAENASNAWRKQFDRDFGLKWEKLDVE